MGAGPTASPAPVRRVSEPEEPVGAEDARRLSREFGLSACGDVTRLREVRKGGYRFESWRVRSGDTCFADWADRQEKYAILSHLDQSQRQRDALPWLCGESGGHVAECATQRREPALLIEQPRFAPFLLLRRITKVST